MSWLEKIKVKFVYTFEMKTLIENTTYVGNITTKTFSSITYTFMSRNYIIVTISINFLKKLAQSFNKGLNF